MPHKHFPPCQTGRWWGACALLVLLLGRVGYFSGREFIRIRRTRSRRTQEQLTTVRERHVAGISAHFRVIAGLVAIDHDIRSNRERVLIGAAAKQGVRASALHHPTSLLPSAF